MNFPAGSRDGLTAWVTISRKPPSSRAAAQIPDSVRDSVQPRMLTPSDVSPDHPVSPAAGMPMGRPAEGWVRPADVNEGSEAGCHSPAVPGERHFFQPWVDQQPGSADLPAMVLEREQEHDGPPAQQRRARRPDKEAFVPLRRPASAVM